jgi:hypothetical protein
MAGTKFIFNVRDLRDVAISRLDIWEKEGFIPFPERFGQELNWQNLTTNEKLCLILEGGPLGKSLYASETYALEHFVEEFTRGDILVVHFEDLVGEKGGGSREKQLRAIKEIARFIAAPLTDERAQEIAENLFGGTHTFNRGQIGMWKKIFDPQTAALYEQKLHHLLRLLGYSDR